MEDHPWTVRTAESLREEVTEGTREPGGSERCSWGCVEEETA